MAIFRKVLSAAVATLLFIIPEIQMESPPKIRIDYAVEYLPDEINYDAPIPTYLDSNNNSILMFENWAVSFVCTAHYPLKFETNGYLGNRTLQINSLSRVSDPVDYKDTSKFVYEAYFLYDLEKENTGKLACVSIENKSLSTEIYIFVQSKDPKHKVEFLNSNAHLKYLNPNIIPCSVYNPNLQVSLWKGRTKITNAKYDPRIGFILENYSNPQSGPETFMCHAENSNFTFSRYETILKTEPEEANIAVFQDEEISVSCKCNEDISFMLPNNNNGLTITKHIEKSKEVALTIKGKLGSHTFGCKCGEHSKTWHLQILGPVEISIDPVLKDLSCKTPDNRKAQFTAISCRIKNTCQINHYCLDNGRCNKLFLRGTLLNNVDAGFQIPSPPQSGFAQCSLNGAKKTIEFFDGLSGKIYFNVSKAVEGKDLVKWDDVEPELYTDQEAIFVCEAVAYLFVFNQPRILLTYKDGTKKILIEGNDFIYWSDELFDTRSRPGYNLYAIKMNVTTNIDKISCLQGWAESKDYFELPKKLNIIKVAEPKIRNKDSSIAFTRGQKSQLTCIVEGKPDPDVTWSTTNKQMKLNPVKAIENGLVYLTINFDDPKTEDEGVYICQASNRLGNDTKKISIAVEEPRALTQPQLYGIIFGSLLTFAVLLALLFILWRRYSITKKLLRDLTEDELDQFIKGSPDLIKDFVDAHEKAEHLPYDYQYEIPIKELQFDQNDVLGSGAFGIVIKGVYKKLPVAIKMTKANADVSYFKALLSELKIMIYIGTHPNVVNFLGSFTENIKNSKLAKEDNLYSNSLESEIKRVLAPVLNWPSQIADGMEYLANKKVIHGDLAARNILLTADDVAKITDFGLSRQLYQYSNYTKKTQSPLPWRWMAVESLNELVFSSKSDVWSFGVLLWEIYSLGDIPFPAQQWTTEYTEMIQKGTRLKKPNFASTEIYDMMCQCWALVPDDRPTFANISAFFQKVSAENP